MEKIEVKEHITLDEGKHTGVITDVTRRTEPYDYVDIFIKEDETGMVIKYGCPSTISSNTKLGKVLLEFIDLEKGKMIDPTEVLTEKKVTFVTIHEVGKDGNTYTRVVDNSIRKVKGEKDGQL